MATETTEMRIEGANCSFCLNAALDTLRSQPDVVRADLSARDGCLVVEHKGGDSRRYVEIAAQALHGVSKFGNELQMVQVDPKVAEIHCPHRADATEM